MEYKYTVHLSEDLEKHEETIRKILAFNDSFDGNEEEYLKLCEELFNFKRFLHPGEAMAFYDKSKQYPHLKIQDIDYTEIKDKKIPEKYRENISGIIEMQYLLNKIEELKKHGIEHECLFIPYSGKLDDTLIVEALRKYGWENKTIGKQIKDFTNMRLMKDQQVQLKLRIQEYLMKIAWQHCSKLNNGERKRLELTANGGNHANWKDYIVKFEGFDFKLRKMIIGYGDINKMKPGEINKVVNEMLNQTQHNVEFLQDWKEGEICNKMLHEYWNNPDYLNLKRIVNLRAIDIVLEIVGLIQDKNYSSKLSVELSKKNQLFDIGYKPKIVDRERTFYDKLAARRVAIALSSLYDTDSENFNLGHISSFIIKGVSNATEINKGKIEHLDDLIGVVISKYLGLRRRKNKIEIHRLTVMTEELDFVNIYVSNILSLKKFITQFDPKPETLSGFEYDNEAMNDLSDFNEFIYEFQRQRPGKLNLLIKEIKDVLHDTMFVGAKIILSLSNPLFL